MPIMSREAFTQRMGLPMPVSREELRDEKINGVGGEDGHEGGSAEGEDGGTGGGEGEDGGTGGAEGEDGGTGGAEGKDGGAGGAKGADSSKPGNRTGSTNLFSGLIGTGTEESSGPTTLELGTKPRVKPHPLYNPVTFPNPKVNYKECGQSVPSEICDPDSILSLSEREAVEARIGLLMEHHHESAIRVALSLAPLTPVKDTLLGSPSTPNRTVSQRLRDTWKFKKGTLILIESGHVIVDSESFSLVIPGVLPLTVHRLSQVETAFGGYGEFRGLLNVLAALDVELSPRLKIQPAPQRWAVGVLGLAFVGIYVTIIGNHAMTSHAERIEPRVAKKSKAKVQELNRLLAQLQTMLEQGRIDPQLCPLTLKRTRQGDPLTLSAVTPQVTYRELPLRVWAEQLGIAQDRLHTEHPVKLALDTEARPLVYLSPLTKNRIPIGLYFESIRRKFPFLTETQL
ncbi:MAG: uncharacterized protein KVP18_001674 [Porospora cf. gigantea A]|uniref:uncharacterized protein n=2 Tax=Porospora cf. gigantea A TaxID=2853593 RepID=UPI0035594985|nr:MAG: hypothetical protein KVP18_001674 [Porospora cf. gigantea A]